MPIKVIYSAAVVAAISMLSPSTQAETILVDYDDGNLGNGIHDVEVRNGGFESPTATTDQPFSNTANWTNLEGLDSANARRTNIQDTGDFSSVNSVSSSIQYGLNTQHTIVAGDIFFLEFRARGASGATAASTLTADLYYTDTNLIGGAVTTIGTVTATNMAQSFATYSDTFAAIGATDTAVGKNLFLRFDQTAGPGFTRTDSWYLTVVPEPSSLALLSLSGLFIARRRKK